MSQENNNNKHSKEIILPQDNKSLWYNNDSTSSELRNRLRQATGWIFANSNLTNATNFVERLLDFGTQLLEFGAVAAEMNNKVKQFVSNLASRCVDPQKTQILRQALLCAWMSQQAYSSPFPVQMKFDDRNRFVTIDCSRGSSYKTNSVFWFVAKHVEENVAYLVFRGTSSPDDVIIDLTTDLDFPQYYKDYNLKVHKGIQSAFVNDCHRILMYLDKVLDASTTLYITGHSLGGGCALLAYLYLKSQVTQFKRKENVFVYSFGSPLMIGSAPGGWNDYLLMWEQNVFCFVNNCDIVPRLLGNKNLSLPRSISIILQDMLRQQSNRNLLFLQNFLEQSNERHTDLSTYIPYGNSFLFVNPSTILRAITPEDEEAMYSIVAPVALGALQNIKNLIDDHAIANYIGFIKKWVSPKIPSIQL
jgi:hypothetical protein